MRYVQAKLASVACAIVTWELVIHFDREVKTIWRRRFNPISVGYVVARYWTIIALFGGLYLSFWVSERHAEGARNPLTAT